MSLTKKYGCGCDDNTKVFNKQGAKCCDSAVQSPPTPCCESHDTVYLTSICFRPTCNTVATVERFFIKFDNICNEDLPIASSLKFFDQAAGLLNIHNRDNDTFEVSLVDATREGAIIQEGACVIVTVVAEGSASGFTSNRCLSGQFVAPAVNAETNIVILNGTGIPIGSTITFTSDGDTGSYLVTDFVSSSASLYAYKIKNTGSGHVPGTIIDGGIAGECLVPIEVITEVDLCDLSSSQTADTLTACVQGSPRGFVSNSEDSVPAGDGSGGWVQKKFTNFDCCIFTDGVVKFTGVSCTETEDTVNLQDTDGITCFSAAWQVAQAANASLIAYIEGIAVHVVEYDGSQITIRPVDPEILGVDEQLEFVAGAKICLGECCARCTNGPQTTNQRAYPGIGNFSPFWILEGSLPFNDSGEAAIGYLIGFNTSGSLTVTALDATYNDDLEPIIGKPAHDDPLVFRQKICNTNLKGCDQRVEVEFSCELAISGMPANLRAHFEFAHFAMPSVTLADGTTPNPYTTDPLNAIFTTASLAGFLQGPSEAGNLDTTTITNTSIGVGDPDGVKVFPRFAGFFKDYFPVKQCDCANSIFWLYVRMEPVGSGVVAGTALFRADIRRILKRYDLNDVAIPENDYNVEGFA